MNRILTWHHQEAIGSETRIGPTYYMEADYTPVAARVYVVDAPARDVEVDIFDDGVSIFSNRKSNLISPSSGVRTIVSDSTAVVLPKSENSDEMAGDFATSLIEEGSWVYCKVVEGGGGKNFTVQLEISSQDEILTEEE